MCARRFLFIILVLTLLAVAAAFAIFQFGGNVLLRQATPQGHFARSKAGDHSDYRVLNAWIARPELSDNPSGWHPRNEVRVDPIAVDARVFYIHPTTYLERSGWNAPLFPDGQTEFRTRLFVQSQASAFNQTSEIWAPRYRQAAYGAFLLKSDDAQKALNLAYTDVEAAFEEFLRQVPREKPIILAGHSQGALHLVRLLRERIAGTPVARRVAAAYVVGWPISTTADLPTLGLPACREATESGCILSWMTFGDPPNPDFILDPWMKSRGFSGGPRRQEEALCVNPISGTENGRSSAGGLADMLVPTADFRDAGLAPGVGAHCDKGLLILDGKVSPLGGFVLPGNNYHAYDYALFWGAIRRDVERRLQAWHHKS